MSTFLICFEFISDNFDAKKIFLQIFTTIFCKETNKSSVSLKNDLFYGRFLFLVVFRLYRNPSISAANMYIANNTNNQFSVTMVKLKNVLSN